MRLVFLVCLLVGFTLANDYQVIHHRFFFFVFFFWNNFEHLIFQRPNPFLL